MKSPIGVEVWRYLLTTILLAVLVMVKQGIPVIAQDAPNVCTDHAIRAGSTAAAAAQAIPGTDNIIGGDDHSNVDHVELRGNDLEDTVVGDRVLRNENGLSIEPSCPDA